MHNAADAQASLEAVLKDEIIRMYEEVADNPTAEFHFFHGREAAELFGYDPDLLDRAPVGAVNSFAGVGNPHQRADLKPGETVLDLGSWLVATEWAFSAGHATVGYALGASLSSVALLVATTDICVPSMIFRKIFGPPRPRGLDPAGATPVD